jgi:RNA polymerase sigma-32 factor
VTYAGYWIRAYVLDLVVRSTTMVGAGSGPLRSKLFFRLRRERARVSNLTGDQEERIRMMAERFDVDAPKMRQMLRRLDSRDVSLSTAVFDDSTTTLLDTLVEDGPGQEALFLGEERADRISGMLDQALGSLDRRERYIVEQRYLGDESRSLASIGRDLGVSRERARQLEARAKTKLRQRLPQRELEAVS